MKLNLTVFVLAFALLGETSMAKECKNIKKVDVSVLQDHTVLSRFDYNPSVFLGMIDFYNSGGKGDLIQYDGSGKSAGFYIQVSQLPAFDLSLNDLLRRDERIAKEVQKILNQGIPVFYSHVGRGVVARVNHAGMNIYDDAKACAYIGNAPAFIEMNSYTDLYSLRHEVLHYKDVQSGFFDDLNGALKPLEANGYIQKDELDAIYFFIIEQRAYADQVSSLRQLTLQNGPEFLMADGKVEIVSATNFAKSQIEERKKRFQYFTKRLAPVLNRLRIDSPESYSKTINLIQKNCMESSDFDLNTLMPDHF